MLFNLQPSPFSGRFFVFEKPGFLLKIIICFGGLHGFLQGTHCQTKSVSFWAGLTQKKANQVTSLKEIWVFPKIGVPQNG